MPNEQEEKKDYITQADRERGQRLRCLRGMLGLSVNQFADTVGISRVTMSYWENATRLKLSKKGAYKVIGIMREHKVHCTFEWLWDGIGDGARMLSKQGSTPESIVANAGHHFTSTEKEIDLFLTVNKDAAIVKIHSATLWPFFEFNDIVAGLWLPLAAFRSEGYCIIKIDEIQEVRWVKKIVSEKPPYQVETSYSPYSAKKEDIKVIEVEKVAPITRLWR